ncbi:MAG: L,D-transpeptidase family protein [Rickettsiales bacterium]
MMGHPRLAIRRFSFVITVLFAVGFGSASHAATHKINGDLVGKITSHTVKHDENLYDIARRYDIGIVELLAANPGVDPWAPPKGTKLIITRAHVLPAVREGIVLNLSELRLFYFVDDKTVMTFPIGIGREGWETPLGETSIVQKREHPSWTPPNSIREENPDLPTIISAGPDNPLGDYAMSLGWPSYAIHGTNRPYGVGKRSSHGCIRMYPEDIKTLFAAAAIGTKVTVVDTPYKLGWVGDTLYLEVTPTQTQSDAIAQYRVPHPLDIPEIYDTINATNGHETEISWYSVDATVARRSGIPVAIGKRTGGY